MQKAAPRVPLREIDGWEKLLAGESVQVLRQR